MYSLQKWYIIQSSKCRNETKYFANGENSLGYVENKFLFCLLPMQKSHVCEIHYYKRKSTHLSFTHLKLYAFLLNWVFFLILAIISIFLNYNYLILDTPMKKIQDNKRVQGKCIDYTNIHM